MTADPEMCLLAVLRLHAMLGAPRQQCSREGDLLSSGTTNGLGMHRREGPAAFISISDICFQVADGETSFLTRRETPTCKYAQAGISSSIRDSSFLA
jgi:hypothetical protein